MNTSIQMVAIDLDGTLLNDNGTVDPQTQQVIQQVIQKGIYVTLATGRNFSSAEVFANLLGIPLPLIAYNGAMIAHNWTNRIVDLPLNIDLVRYLLQELQNRGYYIKVYLDDKLYVQQATEETFHFSKKHGIPFIEVGNYQLTRLSKNPHKIVVIAEEDEINELDWNLSNWKSVVSVYKSSPQGIEIVHKNASKSKALSYLCTQLNIDRSQTMAIGNEGNDLDMIRWAGLGIAMGNATEEIKRHAQWITRTNQEMGVAHALTHFLIPEHSGGERNC